MKDQIKSYLQRLNHGEALENVQADFVRECKDVDPAEIMHAEQELLREGTSIEELQWLCDVHSALFHGSTTEEKIANVENMKDQRLSAAAALIQISGHPLQTFTLENAALEKLIARMEEMIYKESNILFPNCALNFSEEEWYHIYRDAKDYAECFGIRGDSWEAAEAHLTDTASTADTMSAEHAFTGSETRIHLPSGSLTLSQLTAMLNTIPLEISFVDIDNINRYFNEGPKVFKRPGMALGREVFTCHPPKIEERVRRIIGEFRAGNLDQVPVWMDKDGRTFLVTYYAVRDKQEQYLGTLELVQDMEFAKEHFR